MVVLMREWVVVRGVAMACLPVAAAALAARRLVWRARKPLNPAVGPPCIPGWRPGLLPAGQQVDSVAGHELAHGIQHLGISA
jgi:hypothetical protein